MMTPAGRAYLDAMRLGQVPESRLPWGGRSPRVLTKAYKRFSLRQEALPLDESREEEIESPEGSFG